MASDPGRRLVRLEGTLDALQNAFGTQLRMYEHEGRTFQARSGALAAPKAVAEAVEDVLGLDERPIATPKLRRPTFPAATAGFLPNQVTVLYSFPSPAGRGRSHCIGVIELGGGFDESDIATAFQAMRLSAPKVIAVPVGVGSNASGKYPDAHGEVALDIQAAGAGAPGATLAVYFAANTDQGFVDAISQGGANTLFGSRRPPSALFVDGAPFLVSPGLDFDEDEADATGSAAIASPMPGHVVNVQVSAGQSVAKGQPPIAVEAMKMERVLTAPFDGRVAELAVEAAQQVQEGAALARLTPAEAG